MPKFLTRDELYRVIQRELPEDVYADGPPSGFYTTADSDSVAKTLATVYANLLRIYENYFPQLADERISDWEITVFDQLSDATVDLQTRIDRVVAKLRARPGIKPQDMIDIVQGYLGASTEVEVWDACHGMGWILDVSQLDIDTYLNGFSGAEAYGPFICEETGADHGMTEEEWEAYKEDAYTFEVRIYNRTLTTEEREMLDVLLTKGEPARSTHIITDGLTDADKLDGDT